MNKLYDGNLKPLNSQISLINELFHKMNLKERNEKLEIKLTTDDEEPPQPSSSIKAYQLDRTKSEFEKYLQRKQQQQKTSRETMNSENTFDDKEEDLLTDIRAIDTEVDYEKITISKDKQSNQETLRMIRNHTESTFETSCNRKLCKYPKRDLIKMNKNKQIIERAYAFYVEGKTNDKSHSPICQKPNNSQKRNIAMKPTKSVENLSKLQATIKKNYFRF